MDASGGARSELEGEKLIMLRIETWCRETARMANMAAQQALDTGSNKARCLEQRLEIIQHRWESAKQYIPAGLHSALKQILEEPP